MDDVPSGFPVTMLPSESAAAEPPPPVSVAGITVPSGNATATPPESRVPTGPSARDGATGGVSIGDHLGDEHQLPSRRCRYWGTTHPVPSIPYRLPTRPQSQ